MPERNKYQPVASDLIDLEGDGMYRASGDCVCSACGKLYYDHPSVEGYEFLNRICNGDFVKL